jgi:hypothetical protein
MLRLDIARGPGCLLLAAVFVLNAGCVTNGSGERTCDLDNPRVFKLKIQTRTLSNGTVEPTGVNHGNGTSANLLHVCTFDTVRWDLKDHQFEIAFDKGTASPFGWPSQKSTEVKPGKWSLLGLVADSAPKHVELKYSIAIVGGGKYDPIIIVDR